MAKSFLNFINRKVNQLQTEHEASFNSRYDKRHVVYEGLSDYELLRKKRYLSDNRKMCLFWSKYVWLIAMIFLVLAIGLDVWSLNNGVTWAELNQTSVLSTLGPFILITLLISFLLAACTSQFKERLGVIADVESKVTQYN